MMFRLICPTSDPKAASALLLKSIISKDTTLTISSRTKMCVCGSVRLKAQYLYIALNYALKGWMPGSVTWTDCCEKAIAHMAFPLRALNIASVRIQIQSWTGTSTFGGTIRCRCQYVGQKLEDDLIIDQSNCHPQCAGKGIEYSWGCVCACAKGKYRQYGNRRWREQERKRYVPRSGTSVSFLIRARY
jgi:hypothetical protein